VLLQQGQRAGLLLEGAEVADWSFDKPGGPVHLSARLEQVEPCVVVAGQPAVVRLGGHELRQPSVRLHVRCQGRYLQHGGLGPTEGRSEGEATVSLPALPAAGLVQLELEQRLLVGGALPLLVVPDGAMAAELLGLQGGLEREDMRQVSVCLAGMRAFAMGTCLSVAAHAAAGCPHLLELRRSRRPRPATSCPALRATCPDSSCPSPRSCCKTWAACWTTTPPASRRSRCAAAASSAARSKSSTRPPLAAAAPPPPHRPGARTPACRAPRPGPAAAPGTARRPAPPLAARRLHQPAGRGGAAALPSRATVTLTARFRSRMRRA
jgi:hypothetical protein